MAREAAASLSGPHPRRSPAERRAARRGARASADGAIARLSQQLAELQAVASALGAPGVRERLAAASPALAALCCGLPVAPAARLRRNVAMHAAALPSAHAPQAEWRRAQRGPRLGSAPLESAAAPIADSIAGAFIVPIAELAADYIAEPVAKPFTAPIAEPKAWQRTSDGHKNAWYNFVQERGHKDFVPKRRDESTLTEFLSMAATEALQAADAQIDLITPAEAVERAGDAVFQADHAASDNDLKPVVEVLAGVADEAEGWKDEAACLQADPFCRRGVRGAAAPDRDDDGARHHGEAIDRDDGGARQYGETTDRDGDGARHYGDATVRDGDGALIDGEPRQKMAKSERRKAAAAAKADVERVKAAAAKVVVVAAEAKPLEPLEEKSIPGWMRPGIEDVSRWRLRLPHATKLEHTLEACADLSKRLAAAEGEKVASATKLATCTADVVMLRVELDSGRGRGVVDRPMLPLSG